jgi:dynein heavy chain
MTVDLDKMFRALYDGKIPELWMSKSYPTLKSLANYLSDLNKRVDFFHTWVKQGIPQ